MIEDIPNTVLRALLLIEEYGSVTKAAQKLGISQPAVSKGITQLETQLSISLLRRGLRPLKLTEEGATLARHAERIQAIQEATCKRLEEQRRNQTGLIRIGSFGASASTRLLPKYLSQFNKRYPKVRVQIQEMADQDTLNALRDGEVDFALMIEPENDEFDVLPITTDKLVALVKSNTEFARNQHLTAAQIMTQPFILTKGGSEPLIRSWFNKSGTALEVEHTVQQVTSILAFVRAGLGISIIAELAVPQSHDGVSIIPLKPVAPRQICLARENATMKSQAAETLWTFLEHHILD